MDMETETREMALAQYVARYRDADRFAGYCRECGNYGRCRLCPPFARDDVPDFGAFRHIMLIAARFEVGSDVAPAEVMEYLRHERIRLEEKLLELEREHDGRAFGFSGSCPYCECCSRSEGESCRHPEKARPSLEAYGFDLCRTMEELFGRSLQWSESGAPLRDVTLIGALIYNG